MIIAIILHIIEILIWIYLGLSTLYILVFGVAGLFGYSPVGIQHPRPLKIAVLIPGYKEDRVIVDVARDALNQNYPKQSYEVVVIADSFKPETVKELQTLPIHVVEVKFEKSTKSKSLNAAMQEIGDDFDIALILDADNLMLPDFLNKIAGVFDGTVKAVQGHRIAKNMNTSMAVLDAISEEINNRIFRKGHRVLGLSSALIGSGMAFEYKWFKSLMQEVKAIGGFDKELELRMLKSRYRIEYHPDAYVLDEKVQQKEVFASQRKRWLSAQFIYFGRYIGVGLKELFLRANVDLFDKVIQMIQLPRLILIGLLTLIGFITGIITWIDPLWAHENMMIEFYNWLTIWSMAAVALLISVPAKFYNKNTLKAIMSLPGSFIVMLLSLFKLRGANRQFIHTQHGVESSDKINK